MKLRVLTVGLALVFAALSPEAAEGGSTGTVITRLELRGPIPADDSFMIYRGSSEPGAIIEPGSFVCGPQNQGTTLVCFPGTYETETPPLPLGSTVSYEMRLDTESDDDYTVFCEGTVAVREGRQTITCVYDYALGTQPLPDTAMPTPSP